MTEALEEFPNEDTLLERFSQEELETLSRDVDQAGGMFQYILQHTQTVIEELGFPNLTASLGEEVNYRGSGSYIPVIVTNGDKTITEIHLTSAPGGVMVESLVGLLYITDEGIKQKISVGLNS
ncbi:hypothetical protein M0R04_01370 [Candidatus Dojkabacteria bacterium]|nr:hypothetical protein [Candidatus Dojkabacteria bacterium]